MFIEDHSLVAFQKLRLPELASGKEKYDGYPLSRIAQIFNRAIMETQYRADSISLRGEIRATDGSRGVIVSGDPYIIKVEFDDINIYFKKIVLVRSPRLIKKIDEFYAKFQEHFATDEVANKSEVLLKLGAFVCMLYGMLHPFADANGRIAYGLLDYILRANNAGQSLDIEKLSADPEHQKLLILSGLSMAPSPYSYLDFARTHGEGSYIDMTEEIDSKEKFNIFYGQYERHISILIDSFDVSTGEFDLPGLPQFKFFKDVYNEYLSFLKGMLIER